MPTTLKFFSSMVALGKLRNRLMSSSSKSSLAFSILLASVFTMSAIFPFSNNGMAMSNTMSTAMTIAEIFKNFFIIIIFAGRSLSSKNDKKSRWCFWQESLYRQTKVRKLSHNGNCCGFINCSEKSQFVIKFLFPLLYKTYWVSL